VNLGIKREIPLDLQKLQSVTDEWSVEERDLLDTYINEAVNFFSVLQEDLQSLSKGATVKEIGSGIGLLSLLVFNQGFRVISFEPASAGFSLMHKFRNSILTSWKGRRDSVEWVSGKYSPPKSKSEKAVYTFAVNVLEHVQNWRNLLTEVVSNEGEGAQFRIIFPNYAYPYEPHFNIPTAFNKQLTRLIFSKQIKGSSLNDPQTFWNDLSWPTGTQLARFASESGYECSFSPEATRSYLDRVASDETFQRRKGAMTIEVLSRSLPTLHRLSGWIPPRSLPVIDAKIRAFRF